MSKKKIVANSIWVSDVHLGSQGSQVEKFELFLNSISCKNLFLNGDIIDNYLINNTNHIKTHYKSIITQLETLQNKGTHIYFLQGNHDKKEAIENVFLNITFKKEIIYKTLTNKTYLIFHGDKCDTSVKLKTKYIAKFGTKFYEFCLSFKKSSNKPHFSRIIKILSKKIISFLFQNEKKLLAYLENQQVDGVICGHSHQPMIKKIKNKDYLNSGDWIDNCSYIIETYNGEFKLEKWI
tara:strand:- start:1264 stop:1974 length:711 start_codon:yes stop_codon:yes gene_type:complete